MHFDIHIDPTYVDVEAKVLKDILLKEISLKKPSFLKNVTVDPLSVEVKESHIIPITTTNSASVRTTTETVTQTPEPPRRCSTLDLKYCSKMKYNITTYPNILGHRNIKDVQEDVIAFRELVDAECYGLAYEFVCQLLQPTCKKTPYGNEMILPCRSFCRDFMSGCGSRLSEKFKNVLDCGKFPEFESFCITKPSNNTLILDLFDL